MISALYVDDDPSFLEIGKMFLEHSGMIQITTAISAKAALETMQEQIFDVIISDYEMPGMNGIEFLKKIREKNAIIPFIIFTGRGREDVAIEALNSGASFYLQKDGNPAALFIELINMVNRAVQHAHAAFELEKKNEELTSLNEELAASEEELRRTIEQLALQSEQIRESEERYRLVMEATSDGIWDWNLKTNEAFFSDWYYRMIGYEPGEFEGNYENWRSLLHPDDVIRAEKEIQESLTRKDKGFDIEFRIRTKNGDYRYIHGRGKVVAWDNEGNPCRMVGSHIDITDRKRMESALLDSEEKYRLLAEKSRDLIFMLRLPEWKYEYISPSVLEITGYTQEEFYRNPDLLRRCIAPHSLEYFEKAYKDLLNGIIPETYEFQIITKSGELKWVSQRNSPITDKSGTITALQGIVTDITERKTSEEIVCEAMQKYETLFSSVPTGIIVTDENGAIIEVNQHAARILHVSREELIDKGISRPEWTIFKNDGTIVSSSQTYPLLELLKQGENIAGIEIGIQNPNGEIAWIMATASLLRLKGYGSVVSFLDIGEQRRISQALTMVNKKLSLLTSITRHDVKNSLTALKGFLYLLAEEIDTESEKELIGRIGSITGDIERKILFTSTYQNIGAESPQWQNISHLVDALNADGMKVVNELKGLEVFADQMLGMVFENLIQNSLMHGEKVSQILLSKRQEGQDLIILYEDDGIGIPDSEKENIFERGYGKNTGFGLFLIKEILSITGLSIRETGKYGEGARFEILVPQGSYRFS
ncbi:multi-sensor signal transduction histidine kinase [Methanospirillum hungatei JF-1]|uniref:histidine kinase n=1 Tax=Methanospirillum hungatei JF-1 (strain ATCC 27890 / DSM 864 / NBRC 100397 / JF-1) TaxID=323259 RepID=Q2FUG3_METHJ|nr:PAS domain-containing protein [Methanospirillum hungatei]ABD40309.1 multi-sensor signal transduction histidine kinase [Methanospirillum hungatei JF-1]